MNQKLTIKKTENILKTLVILLESGFDFSFSDIEHLRQKYREIGEVCVYGLKENIDNVCPELDRIGVVYSIQ